MRPDWLSAFPIAEAEKAVRAIREGWAVLAATPKDGFKPSTHEPKLTRVLCAYVDRVVARELGMLGLWGTETVENEVDFETATIVEERRTDILYAWNNDLTGMRLIFEFKKLDHKGGSRSKYLGQEGLMRFVTGRYSRKQAIAAMVGIMTAPEEKIVSPLVDAIRAPAIAKDLRLCTQSSGDCLDMPSLLFPAVASFDTEHHRDVELAPTHGTIRIAHIFLAFGQPS